MLRIYIAAFLNLYYWRAVINDFVSKVIDFCFIQKKYKCT